MKYCVVYDGPDSTIFRVDDGYTTHDPAHEVYQTFHEAKDELLGFLRSHRDTYANAVDRIYRRRAKECAIFHPSPLGGLGEGMTW